MTQCFRCTIQEVPTWPIPSNVLGITSLKLYYSYLTADVICGTLRSCKALTSFKFVYHSWQNNAIDVWCAEVVRTLQKHRESLTSLELQIAERVFYRQLNLSFKRVDGFQSLHALEILEVPFFVLMGKPSGLYRNDVWIPDPGQEEYPTLKDVLPPGLRELTLHAGRWSAFGTALETKFKTYLSLGSTVKRIEKVSLYWDPLESDYPLPMNFWSIKKFYSEHEVRVDYTLQIMYGKSRSQDMCLFPGST
jgi:hypothetical protein